MLEKRTPLPVGEAVRKILATKSRAVLNMYLLMKAMEDTYQKN